jgi:hypothetical protein
MLVSPAPIAIPVNTANLPTEAVRAEAAQRPQIPQPASNAKNPSSKNSTEFSEQAKAALQNDGIPEGNDKVTDEQSEQKQEQSQQQQSENRATNELEAEEQAIVRELQARDREVRAHEQAHAAVGGNLAGAPSLSFTTGPDGKRYAVSGEVSISVGAVANNPQATIDKLEQVQRAALAPANPSSQDRKVASQAAASIGQARSELRSERLRESEEAANNDDEKSTGKVGSRKLSSGEGTSNRLSLDSSGNAIANPISARQQSLQLNLKIANSGAFDVNESSAQISVRA